MALSISAQTHAGASSLEYLAAVAFSNEDEDLNKDDLAETLAARLSNEQNKCLSNSERKRYLNKCLICNKNVIWLKRHLKGAHNLDDVLAAHFSRDMCRKPSKSKDARPLKTCSVCGFKVQRLDQHFKKIHKMDCSSEEYRKCILQSKRSSGYNNMFLYGIEDNGDVVKKDWFVADIRKEFDAVYKNKVIRQSVMDTQDVSLKVEKKDTSEAKEDEASSNSSFNTSITLLPSNNGFHFNWEEQRSNLVTSIQDSFLSEAFTDVVIYCGKTAIPCHKYVLASVSPFMKLLLEDPTTDAIYLPENQFAAVQAIVSFIYSGKVNLSVDLLCEFWEIAKALDITFLVDSTEVECMENGKQQDNENSNKVTENSEKELPTTRSEPSQAIVLDNSDGSEQNEVLKSVANEDSPESSGLPSSIGSNDGTHDSSISSDLEEKPDPPKTRIVSSSTPLAPKPEISNKKRKKELDANEAQESENENTACKVGRKRKTIDEIDGKSVLAGGCVDGNVVLVKTGNVSHRELRKSKLFTCSACKKVLSSSLMLSIHSCKSRKS